MAVAAAAAAAAAADCTDANDGAHSVAVQQRAVQSHPLIQRIQSLLLPQDFGDDQTHWKSECDTVCAAFGAYDRDPSNAPLDASQWCDATRPLWPGEHNNHNSSARAATAAYPTPLFAFVRLTQSFGPEPAADVTARATALFHVLLRSGCSRAAALNARDRTGMTPLLQAVCGPEPNIAAPLLVDTAAVDVSALAPAGARPWRWSTKALALALAPSECRHICCAVCKLVLAATVTKAAAVGAAAWSAIARLTDAQLLERVRPPHRLMYDAMDLRETATVVIARVERAWHATTAPGSAQRRALHDALVTPTKQYGGFFGTALTCAATADDGTAWRLLTDPSCAVGAAMLAHANTPAQFPRDNTSPLHAALTVDRDVADAARVADADRRASWLVPRLCSEQLNKYGGGGCTPLHAAFERRLPLTLRALLARVRDLDLTLVEATTGEDAPAEWPLCAEDFESYRTVPQMLDAAQFWCDTPELKALVRDFTIKAKWQCEQLPPLIAAVARPALQKRAQLPREIVALCFAYAALPLPSGAEAADAPAPKRQRTN